MKKLKHLLFLLIVASTVVFLYSTVFAATIGQALTAPEDSWLRIDDSNSNISYFNFNGSFADSRYYYGSANYASQNNSQIKFNFTGSKIRLMFHMGSGASASMKVEIDGTAEYFALVHADPQVPQGLAYEKTGLSTGEHSVVITDVQHGSWNFDVYFDSLDIDQNGSIKPFNSIIPPSNLTASVTNNQVALTWNAVTDATGYNVKRSTSSGGPYTTIASNISANSFTDTTAAAGTTYYYIVTSINSTESGYSNEVSVTVQVNNPTIDVTSQDLVKVGDEFTADIVLNNVTNICAEDVKITYDTTIFDYVGTQDITGLKIYNSTQTTPGALRFIVASLGKDNAANGQKTILKLIFKGKAIGQGKIDVIKGRIADNGTLEMDVADENCGEKLITVKSKDVNRTGDFTLLDLAIDAWYYGDTIADTDTAKYDADVVVNDNVDDADLSTIVVEMLKNSNYTPNI